MARNTRSNYQVTSPVQALTRMTAPNTMRYQANDENECRLTKRSSHLVTASALANEATQLTTSGAGSVSTISARAFHNSYPVAASRTGMARKNENSAAVRRESPDSRPPMIVAPD